MPGRKAELRYCTSRGESSNKPVLKTGGKISMKQKIMPIVAVAVGLLAFWLTGAFLRSKAAALQAEFDRQRGLLNLVEVIVAARDMPAGTMLGKEDIGVNQILESTSSERNVLPKEDKSLLGRRILSPQRKGVPILWSDIEGGGPSSQGLASIIKYNSFNAGTFSNSMRAISLSISGAAGLSGMLQPNDRVDVLGTFSFPVKDGKGEDLTTITVLQNVTVLAVGQTLAKQSYARGQQRNTGYSTVTLEVTPGEAEVLVFAQQIQGRLTLALRNPNDMTYQPSMPEVNFLYIEKELEKLNNIRQKQIRSR
ncbi:MAG: Flp pilus assembly protein CpaB [Verrucomicrobia bacterium]|nr:Flp pilus assembly protein CpaB [Verrucomicrobiota bacterium]